LEIEENSEFSLIKDIINPIMFYVILLYIWGEDNKEVNFGNLRDGSRKTKDGYKKLWFYR
jgi:hypothetical protein